MHTLRFGLVAALTLIMEFGTAQSALAQHSTMPAPRFSRDCTASQQYALAEAAVRVDKMIDEAVAAVDHVRSGKEYREAFGAYDGGRHAKVQTRLALIRKGTLSIPVQANCEPAGQSRTCNDGAWAYITKQALGSGIKYIINFCSSYFSATKQRVREISAWSEVAHMQAAVYLHELTHFAWSTELLRPSSQSGQFAKRVSKDSFVEGAKDQEYDEEGVKYLAETEPDKAIANADSYHIFMMKLGVRNRTIFR